MAGYDVILIVADRMSVERRDGARIVDVGMAGSRLSKMLHDPKLLPADLSLHRRDKCVIVDVRRELFRQVLSGSCLYFLLQRSIFKGVRVFACRSLHIIVAAMRPSIKSGMLTIR